MRQSLPCYTPSLASVRAMIGAAAVLAAVVLFDGSTLPTAAQDTPAEAQQYASIRAVLNAKRIDVDFNDTQFRDAIDTLREQIGVAIAVDPKMMEEVRKEPITLLLRNSLAQNALDLVVGKVKLKVGLKHGVVWITSPEELAKGQTVLRIYDVRDITARAAAKMAPKTNEGSGQTRSTTTYSGSRSLTSGLPFRDVDDDESNSGPPAPGSTPAAPGITLAEIEQLIRQLAGGDSWNTNAEASIIQVGGLLLVRQTADVQKDVERLLDALRRIQ